MKNLFRRQRSVHIGAAWHCKGMCPAGGGKSRRKDFTIRRRFENIEKKNIKEYFQLRPWSAVTTAETSQQSWRDPGPEPHQELYRTSSQDSPRVEMTWKMLRGHTSPGVRGSQHTRELQQKQRQGQWGTYVQTLKVNKVFVFPLSLSTSSSFVHFLTYVMNKKSEIKIKKIKCGESIPPWIFSHVFFCFEYLPNLII